MKFWKGGKMEPAKRCARCTIQPLVGNIPQYLALSSNIHMPQLSRSPDTIHCLEWQCKQHCNECATGKISHCDVRKFYKMYCFLLCSRVKTQSTRNPSHFKRSITQTPRTAKCTRGVVAYDDVKNVTLGMNVNLKLYSTSRELLQGH